MKSKRGLAEVLGYVLLVVLAIGLSVGVYSYLKVYVPKDRPECSEDIHIVLDDYIYNINSEPALLELTLLNKGLFSIDGAYIRMAKEGRNVRFLINDGKERIPGGIKPDDTYTFSTALENLDLSAVGELDETMELEIQPAVESEEFGLVLCESAVVTQKIISAVQD